VRLNWRRKSKTFERRLGSAPYRKTESGGELAGGGDGGASLEFGAGEAILSLPGKRLTTSRFRDTRGFLAELDEGHTS